MSGGYTYAWIAWGLGFLAIEGLALWDKDPNDTLSEHVWAWASVRHKGRWWQLRRFALLTLMAWLTAHFLTGMWV